MFIPGYSTRKTFSAGFDFSWVSNWFQTVLLYWNVLYSQYYKHALFYALGCTFLSCCLQLVDGMRTPSFPFKWEWCFSFNVRITQLWEFRRTSLQQQDHYEDVHQILNKISRKHSIKQCYCMQNTEQSYMIYRPWFSSACVKPQTQRTSTTDEMSGKILHLRTVGFTILTKA